MGEGRGLTTKVYTVCVVVEGEGSYWIQFESTKTTSTWLHFSLLLYYNIVNPTPADGRIQHQRDQSDPSTTTTITNMKRTAPTASQLVQRSLYTHQRSCLRRGGAVTSIGIGTSRCASSDVSSSFRPVAVPLQSIHRHRNTRSINDNVNSISSLNHRRHNQRQQRNFSSVPSPTISTSQIQSSILSNAPQIAHHLTTHGYYTTTNFLPPPTISLLRSQAITLRTNGRFEPSWSEAIQSDGSVTRFDKEGVFACEPDGQDYDSAPDLIT